MEPALRRAAAGVAVLVVMALVVWGLGPEYPGAIDLCWGDDTPADDGHSFVNKGTVWTLVAAPFVLGAWGAWAATLTPRGRRLALGVLAIAALPALLMPLTANYSLAVYLLVAIAWAVITATGNPVGLLLWAGVTAAVTAAVARRSARTQRRWAGVLYVVSLTAVAAHVLAVGSATDGAIC